MATRQEYIDFAVEAAQDAGISPDIFVRQIAQESGFEPYLADGSPKVSPAGAVGIAQIMPQYHPGVDPTDPWASLTYAAGLTRAHLDRFGSYALALAAYNAGAGAVEKYGGIPPYEETRRYVSIILGDGALADLGADPIPGDITGGVQTSHLVRAAAVALGVWILLDILGG